MNTLSSLLLPLAFAVPLAAQTTSCSAPLLGLGCGATLDITFTPEGTSGNQRIDLAAHGLHPNAIGVMVWGQTGINLPLGAGCTMWTDFLWGHLIQTDALGDWSWSRVWPASSMPGYYHIQFGSFVIDANGSLEIRAADARTAQCQVQ